jgi:palmitoyl-protein thioesterase
MRVSLKISFLLIFLTNLNIIQSALPVAVFHGIGDSCVINPGMTNFTKKFADRLKVYAKCIETGGGPIDWFTSFKSQADKACKQIQEDVNFQGDFAVIGLSQGALLARHIIQSCEMKGRVKRYISIGGPQMGVGSFPQCTGGAFCKYFNKIVGSAVYFSLVQNHVGPAGYFKDITNYQNYLSYSSFLADLNNERSEKNQTYKERFSNLEKVVLIKFSEDTMIIPKETAWFQFYDSNHEVQDIEETDFYKQDFIGLRKLTEENKINLNTIEGNHLQFSDEDIETIMIPALE